MLMANVFSTKLNECQSSEESRHNCQNNNNKKDITGILSEINMNVFGLQFCVLLTVHLVTHLSGSFDLGRIPQTFTLQKSSYS